MGWRSGWNFTGTVWKKGSGSYTSWAHSSGPLKAGFGERPDDE
jgi:hypothetical protein